MAPAVLDHLWQSTLVALLVAALVALFSKTSASVRYGLWLAASLKFLIPFAALAALGRLLATTLTLPIPGGPPAAFIEKAAQPFSQSALSPSSLPGFPFARNPAADAPLPAVSHQAALPHIDWTLILLAAWALGFAALALAWALRWANLRKVVRSARPVSWPAPMPVLAAPSLVEPGLVGLWRPVLLVPETLPEHLSQTEIAAIVAHEACHLRRRDNLTAALHMLVEALFWFHPMVWWIGGRLIAERERACDEAVVSAGHDRATYARSLVESCRLYLQSPLDCVAGASGSNLKIRVETIMTAPVVSPLSLSKKVLLAAAGVCAVATPVAAGMLTSPEGQKVLTRVAALAVKASHADNTVTADAPTIEISRQRSVLAPAMAVAALDAAAVGLARDVVTPRVEPIQPSADEASAGSPPPTAAQVASIPAADRRTRPAAAPPPLSAADAKAQARAFVKSYAALTGSDATARWASPICVRVVGLTAEQDAAVRERVYQVAEGAGVRVVRPKGGLCGDKGVSPGNVEIGFTTDPQAMLDGVLKGKAGVLGDATSNTRNVRAVTLPVQAWYQTNGVDLARNDVTAPGGNSAASLKVPVVWQVDVGSMPAPTNGMQLGGATSSSVGQNANTGGGFSTFVGQGPWERGGELHRRLRNVLVIVDLRRTDGMSLGLISDYAAMLVLSQPAALGRCSALPSVTDLFAGACPGRGTPDGLTPADAAFLTALYQPNSDSSAGDASAIAERMAKILVGAQLASR